MNSKITDRDPAVQRESLTELLGQLAGKSAAVVHDEIELVIQGIREKVRAVRSGVLTVAAGAAISFAAFLCLCAAMIIKLASYMSPVTAATVTGALLTLIGVIIVFTGCRQLRKSNLKAQKTM